MRRRGFIKAVVGSFAAWPLAVHAQQQPDKPRIGVLMGFAESDPTAQSWVAAFRDALAKLGWAEGSNLRIELRWSAADPDRIRTLAQELVELRPDAILADSTLVTAALKRETLTIPIVFAVVADPIGSGFAPSLARPGGNITGFTYVEPTTGGKWVGLLKEIAPRTAHVAMLFNPATTPQLKFYMPSIQAAASSLAIEANSAPVHARDEIEGVIAAQARNPGGGLLVMPDIFNVANRESIIALAARSGVPAIYPISFFCGIRRPHRLWRRFHGTVPPSGRLHRSHPEGREPGRSADSAADQVRTRDQPQDRESTRAERPSVHAAARRCGDRMNLGDFCCWHDSDLAESLLFGRVRS